MKECCSNRMPYNGFFHSFLQYNTVIFFLTVSKHFLHDYDVFGNVCLPVFCSVNHETVHMATETYTDNDNNLAE